MYPVHLFGRVSSKTNYANDRIQIKYELVIIREKEKCVCCPWMVEKPPIETQIRGNIASVHLSSDFYCRCAEDVINKQ